jgi:hypothetical protein
MQTLRKLSSKKGKFDGIQLGEVVSKNRTDTHNNGIQTRDIRGTSNQHNISHVITHTEPSSSIKGNKEPVSKRAEKVVNAIQKRYDNNKKMPTKEQDIQSPIISIKLVKNENPKMEKRITPIKPKLASPINKVVSFEKKEAPQIKPKLISPSPNKSVLKKHTSPTINKLSSSTISKISSPTINKISSSSNNKISSGKNRRTSYKNDDKPVVIKYNTYEVRTLLSNYEYPKKPYITDYRYKIYTQYYNTYHNMRNFIDRFLLTNLSRGIKVI